MPFKVATVRSRARLITLLLWMVALLPFQIIAVAISPRISTQIPLLFHRVCARIMGIKIRVHGAQLNKPSTLYVSNHSSYLDIQILGSLLPANFISKAEVASWPIFGLLAKLQRSVFIRRERNLVGAQSQGIEARLQKGDSLILFPEGTTSYGSDTRTFYSSLFESAHHAKFIQPISLILTEVDGIPAGRTLRLIYAWPGDLTLPPHFMEVLRQGDLTVDVIFHDIINPAAFPNRKLLSEECRRVIAKGVSDLVSGREITAVAA